MGARRLRDQFGSDGIRVARRNIRTLIQRIGIEALSACTSKPTTEWVRYAQTSLTINQGKLFRQTESLLLD